LAPPAPPPCFVTGTLIRTRRGEVPVDALQVGDEVATRLPLGFRPIRWIGQRTLRRPAADLLPVRIRAGAFGPGLPARDLLLSPDHALYAEGALVPVKHLVDGAAVAPIAVKGVTYWHVELDGHDVLLAEGLAAESYLDTGNRSAFVNAGPVADLHPSFAALTWEGEGCAPVAVTGPAVEALRARLRHAAAERDSTDDAGERDAA
ncbi:MAG: Hint domain-containing protein, partial [Rhodospirillales bacterium]|nr:Hint domain-containing protein [Rhodospirillales bacterium]